MCRHFNNPKPNVFEITGSVANLKKLKNTNYNIYVCMCSNSCAHKPRAKTTLLDACRPHLCLLVNFFTINKCVYEFSFLASLALLKHPKTKIYSKSMRCKTLIRASISHPTLIRSLSLWFILILYKKNNKSINLMLNSAYSSLIHW